MQVLANYYSLSSTATIARSLKNLSLILCVISLMLQVSLFAPVAESTVLTMFLIAVLKQTKFSGMPLESKVTFKPGLSSLESFEQSDR